MTLNRCPKYSPESGIRIKPPQETLSEVLPLLKNAGLDAPEDITGKDDVGIPVFSVRREETAFGKPKFYNGKGADPAQAEASAVMESIERYCAEQRDSDEIVYGTYEQAKDVMLTVNPVDLILPMRVLDHLEGQQIAWTEGFEMFRGCPVWVPACAVYYPYEPDGDYQLFRWHTNGIASGNTMEEAILHALFEDIERDAWSIAEYNETCAADVVVEDEDSVPGRLLAKFAE
ncbi:MAG: YcaO-like family protein, partial [Candidatus Methanomethylophilaceae archaeon]|nr:YcaO-like family protein [Candidatus Methanomethylophilaceae archaeon]